MLNLFSLFRSPRWLFYDAEIINAIPNPKEENDPNLTYCQGWSDHECMGISCIATYSSWDSAYRLFKASELDQFQRLANKSDRVIGFNSLSFDDKLCAANNLKVKTDYDLLSQIWVAAGYPPVYTPGVTVAGYKLQNLALKNLSTGKSGSGELAPVLYQRGFVHQVYSYCLLDVYLSVEILKLGWTGELIDPVNGEKLKLKSMH